MSKKTFLLFSILLLIIHIVILSKTQFIDWPEILLYPWLVKNGFKLYTDLLVPYQPLWIHLLKVVFSFFGFTVSVYRAVELSFVTGIDFILFFVLYKINRSYISTVCGFFLYILWQPTLEGNGLWFDTFTLPFVLLGYYFICKSMETKTKLFILLSGLTIGLLLLTKQTFYWLIPFLLMFSILNLLVFKNKKSGFIILQVVFVALCFPVLQYTYFALNGNSQAYLFWIYKFGLNLGHDINYSIKPNIYGDLPQIIFYFFILLLYFVSFFYNKKKQQFAYDITWLLAMNLLMFPRWTLTHFQASFLILVILFTKSIYTFLKSSNQYYFIPICVLFLFSLKIEHTYIKENVYKPQRFYNEITEQILRLIQETKTNKSYYFFGNVEYFYVYLQETPLVKPYVQLFPWNTDIPGIEENQIAQLGKNKIEYIFYLPYHPENIFFNGHRPEKIYNYMLKEYHALTETGDLKIYKRND